MRKKARNCGGRVAYGKFRQLKLFPKILVISRPTRVQAYLFGNKCSLLLFLFLDIKMPHLLSGDLRLAKAMFSK